MRGFREGIGGSMRAEPIGSDASRQPPLSSSPRSRNVTINGVIPGRVEDANPESRDSGSGPSDHPGMTVSFAHRSSPARRADLGKALADAQQKRVADLAVG